MLCYQSAEDLQWYWRLLASNKRTIAEGVEPYSSKSNLLRAVRRNKALNFEFIMVREEITPPVHLKVNL